MPSTLNPEVFGQFMMLDDPNEPGFVKELVGEFFVQALDTFDKMKLALQNKDIAAFRELGHFLKGSSGSFGADALAETCQLIQEIRDEDQHSMAQGFSLLNKAGVEFKAVHDALESYFLKKHPSK